MIPKDAYILEVHKKDGTKEIIIPRPSSFIGSNLLYSGTKDNKNNYCMDYADVKKFIENNLSQLNGCILVAKVVDVLYIEVKSKYENEND